MKLTKGMKKALSLLLSAALVVTGVNVTTNTAKAVDTLPEGGYEIELQASAVKPAANGTPTDAVLKVNGSVVADADLWNEAGTRVKLSADIKEAINGFNKPTIEVKEIADDAEITIWDFTWAMNGNTVGAGAPKEITTTLAADKEFSIEVPYGNTAKVWIYDAAPATEESSAPEASTGAVTSSTTPSVTTSTAPVTTSSNPEESSTPSTAPSQAPAKDLPLSEEDGYTAWMRYCDNNWGWSNNDKLETNVGSTVKIVDNGTYTLELKKEDFAEAPENPAEGAMVWCVELTGMTDAQNFDTSDMNVKDVTIKVDGKKIATDSSKMYFGNIEDDNNVVRLELCNEWGFGGGDFKTRDVDENDEPVAAGFDLSKVKFEDSVSVTFTLEGIKEGSTPADAWVTADGETVVKVGDGVVEADPEESSDPNASAAPSTEPSSNPQTSSNPTQSSKPSQPTSGTAVTSGSAVSTKAAVTAASIYGTSKLTVAKNLVVVAPGKSTTVKFTAKAAKATSGAAAVTVSTKSKKVATVKKSGSKVKISVPKKAVKGANTTVTVKSKKANGNAISAKIKVYVKNSAKKVKAAKKAITVKKGKKTKLVIKATKVQNKKKPFADTITVKGNVLKLQSVKYAKGKATLTLKGNKKAKKKAVTIKVGKKNLKVKATVK